MDAIDILGSLLGGKPAQGSGAGAGGGGGFGDLGGKILKEILAGGQQRQAPSSSGGSSRSSGGSSRSSQGPMDIESQAKELEDILDVARQRGSGSGHSSGGATTFPSSSSGGGFAQPDHSDFGRSAGGGFPAPPSAPRDRNDEAIVLIRAMINAAKADGRITRDEQQAILSKIGGDSREVASFLQKEFEKPADIREFAWSVPLGMEQKVYTLSLAAIDLDTNPEAGYLRDLAHGLRLDPEVCNQIHQRLGAPTIF